MTAGVTPLHEAPAVREPPHNTNLLHEWVTIPVDSQARRDLPKLGVSWDNLNRCGDPLPVRVRTDGTYFEPYDLDGTVMLVQPVYIGPIPSLSEAVDHPLVADLIAYNPRKPNHWYWRRGELGLVLGDDLLSFAALFHEPVRLFRTPWDWLRAGGRGVCLLDRHPVALERLREVGAIDAGDVALGLGIKRLLRGARPAVPPINVVVGSGAA